MNNLGQNAVAVLLLLGEANTATAAASLGVAGSEDHGLSQRRMAQDSSPAGNRAANLSDGMAELEYRGLVSSQVVALSGQKLWSLTDAGVAQFEALQ